MTYQPEHYQALEAQLQALKDDLEVQKPVKDLARSHLQIQNFFQTQILDAVSSATTPANDISKINNEMLVSYYVEINKQLRLLGSDLTMLQAARTAATVEQRISQASDRLSILISYCNTLLL